jgi:hypothetical protein
MKLMIRMHRVIDPDAVTHADGRGESTFLVYPIPTPITTPTYPYFKVLVPTPHGSVPSYPPLVAHPTPRPS